MAIDVTQPIPSGPRPKWELPEILDIRIRRVPFEPPKLRNFTSALAVYKEAMEFLVHTSGPVPARALGPALYVGHVQVFGGQRVDDHLYRFLALDFDRLEPGAPISWGWINSPEAERQSTRFRFEENS
jgi:hypothetical protein